jgi:hypothetical protein
MSKDALGKISDLSRFSLVEIKRLAEIARIITLSESIDSEDEDGNFFIEIPTVGKIKVSDDLDFEILPLPSFKKEIYSLKQNPKNFLKNELKKLLGIGDINE